MAEPTTISQVLPSPKVEASLTTFLNNLDDSATWRRSFSFYNLVLAIDLNVEFI